MRSIYGHLLRLLAEFNVAAVANPDLLSDTKVREGHGFRRALLIEDLPTVSTMVFPIGKGKGRSTPEADI